MARRNIFLFVLAVFFLFSSQSIYAKNLKKKYYEKAGVFFSQGESSYRKQKLYEAYGYFDKAKSAAQAANRFEKLKPSELEKIRFIIRESRNGKFRILEITNNFKTIITERKIVTGMTKDQVLASWGEPLDIVKRIYKWEEYEDWFYGNALKGNDKYVYFKDGIVINWRDKENK